MPSGSAYERLEEAVGHLGRRAGARVASAGGKSALTPGPSPKGRGDNFWILSKATQSGPAPRCAGGGFHRVDDQVHGELSQGLRIAADLKRPRRRENSRSMPAWTHAGRTSDRASSTTVDRHTFSAARGWSRPRTMNRCK